MKKNISCSFATAAQANTWIAKKLDEYSETAHLITEETIGQLLPEATPTVAMLCEIATGISGWLEATGANGRQVSSNELAGLSKFIANKYAEELAFLAINDESAGQYHMPLYEGAFLTVNMHVWKPGEWTSDHDHGDAGGGITVVKGALTEDIYAQQRWTTVARTSGETFSFGYWVHKMGGAAAGAEQPISIHAYSGPSGGLTEITSFQRESDGSLMPIRTWRKGEQTSGIGCPCMFRPNCEKGDARE